MRNTSKKYSKYAKDFKAELDLKRKDYELYSRLRANISSFESKIREH